MRKFLGTLVILLVVVGGLGFYRGWFNFSTTEQQGETSIELKIDKQKIKEDAESAKEKARDITSGIGEGSSSDSTPPVPDLGIEQN